MLNVDLFYRENQFIIMISLVKLVACRFFVVKNDASFFSWNLLHVDRSFKKLHVSWFMSSINLLCFYFSFRKLLNAVLSLCETCIFIFLCVKPVLFMELLACWICSRNLIYLDIFLRETCCMLIYSFVKLYLLL